MLCQGSCQVLSADPCHQTKLPRLSYGTCVGHWLWVQWPQTLWSLSPIQHLFCYIPVLHQLCYIIFVFSSQPSSLAPRSLLRHISLSSLFLPWVIISSGFLQSSSGSKGVNEKLAEENHLSQPQSSTESLKAGSLKHQAMKLYQNQTDLAKAHNSSRLSWISSVAKALLPNFMLYLQNMGPLGLSEDEVAILFNVRGTYTCWRPKPFWLKFLYTVWDNSWYKHTCITRIQP